MCFVCVCNKVLLKYKGDRESFWHRHQKWAKEYHFASISNGVIYSPMNPKNVWRLQRPHQTHSHNLHFKITELARGLIQRLSSGRIHSCKDQTYSHNLCFKITELARGFNPKTVLRQDTLLLYNPKECRGKKVKKFVLSSSLNIPDPSLLGDP